MDKPIETVAKRLNYAMSIRNINQSELSEKTKISTGSLSQYMNNKISPKQDRIFIMAKALSVSEAWLMGYDVPMDRQEVKKVDYTNLNVEITEDIKILVERYSRLDQPVKETVLNLLEHLLA